MSPRLLPSNKKRSVEILQNTTIIKGNCIKTGLTGCTLKLNTCLKPRRVPRENVSHLAILICKLTDKYVLLGHKLKLSSKTAETTSEITKPHES